MKIAPVAEIKSKFSEFVTVSHKETIIVTKNGRPTAVILGVDNDDDLESIIISNSKLLHKKIDFSEMKMRKGMKVSHKAFWNKVSS